MDNVDNMNRINELLGELNECREDERNTQNQILQVIVTAGTILGVLLGASYFTEQKQFDDAYYKVIFWLSLLTFATAFSYILVLGIGNVLRYYYIQDLEDRLHILISDTDDDKSKGSPFLHWGSFSAPIITRNWKHIASSHTALHFISYSMAALCAGGFSILMIYVQFLKIKNACWYDYAGLYGALFLILITSIMFLRTSSKTREMIEFAKKTACENRNLRQNKDAFRVYRKSREFRHIVCYFIYPKYKDFYKPFLIILGFVGGLALQPQMINIPFLQASFVKLLQVIIIFDFLAYQARYQINDIRGIEEDTNRLFSDGKPNPAYIKASLIIALIRIILAVGLLFIWQEIAHTMADFALVVLLISTIAYEASRKALEVERKGKKREACIYFLANLIYILVGPGYPLRFFLGMSVIIPHIWKSIGMFRLLCLIIALWAYGTYSSLLSWANEVSERMYIAKEKTKRFPRNHKKGHFLVLQKSLERHYTLAEQNNSGKVLPLRNRGEFCDPWNVPYFITLTLFFVMMCSYKMEIGIFVLELISFLIFFKAALVGNKRLILYFMLGCITTVIKGVIIYLRTTNCWWYLFLCCMQLILTTTYFILRYSIQFATHSLFDICLCSLLRLVIGDKAMEILFHKVHRRNS